MEFTVVISQIIFIYCYLNILYSYILYKYDNYNETLQERMKYYRVNNNGDKYTVINLFLVGNVGEHDYVFLKMYKRLCVKLMEIYKPNSIVYDRNGRISLYFYNDSDLYDTIPSRATSILIKEFNDYNKCLEIDITMFLMSRYNIPTVNEMYNHLLYNFRELDCRESYMLKRTKKNSMYVSKLPELNGFNAKIAKKLSYKYLVV